MKSKKFDTVKETRAIRDQMYEQTKNLNKNELLEWHRKNGTEALNKFRKKSNVSG